MLGNINEMKKCKLVELGREKKAIDTKNEELFLSWENSSFEIFFAFEAVIYNKYWYMPFIYYQIWLIK